MGGVWAQLLGSQGFCGRVILVLRECIRNTSAVSIFLSAFGDTGSLGSPPSQVVYPPDYMVTPWVTAYRFLAGNKEAELKPSTFPSLLLFRVFPLFSSPNPPGTLSAACWGYSLIIVGGNLFSGIQQMAL